MDVMLCLFLQFQVARGFAVSAAPAFDVRPGQSHVSKAAGGGPNGDLVVSARDRAAREGRVLVVWVGRRDEGLSASLPRHWLQVGPVESYGGETGPGAAVGVPDGGAVYYRGLVPQTRRAILAEVQSLSPAPAYAPVPRGGNC